MEYDSFIIDMIYGLIDQLGFYLLSSGFNYLQTDSVPTVPLKHPLCLQ